MVDCHLDDLLVGDCEGNGDAVTTPFWTCCLCRFLPDSQEEKEKNYRTDEAVTRGLV